MKLVIVNPTPQFSYTCCRCKREGITDPNGHPVYADLEGEPWKSYYCRICAVAVSTGRGGSMKGRPSKEAMEAARELAGRQYFSHDHEVTSLALRIDAAADAKYAPLAQKARELAEL